LTKSPLATLALAKPASGEVEPLLRRGQIVGQLGDGFVRQGEGDLLAAAGALRLIAAQHGLARAFQMDLVVKDVFVAGLGLRAAKNTFVLRDVDLDHLE